MTFWQLEKHPEEAIALIKDDQKITYGQLSDFADKALSCLPGQRTFGFLLMPNEVAAIAMYLGALRSHRHVPLLVQADIDPVLFDALTAHYKPDWLALPKDRTVPPSYTRVPATTNDAAMTIYLREGNTSQPAPNEQLALLLNTSGSTGSSKLVRLSSQAIEANAQSIATYLGLTTHDRAITTLPLAYSFGMSILNSHLHAGASLILNDHALITREFWDTSRNHDVTSLSGVPATFEMLRRLDLERQQLPSLRTLTQAGGHLRETLTEHFEKLAHKLGLSFFVMYGQTEAAPRISYIPPPRLREKFGSIGIAVPGGHLELDPHSNELIYYGPNVMLGYAEQRSDLALGDTQNGMLRTGDLARVDAEGFYFLTGRAKRFIKISGVRINLDQVEAMLARDYNAFFACSGSDDHLMIFTAAQLSCDSSAISDHVVQRYKLFHRYVQAVTLEKLPLLGNGKVDYRTLATLGQQRARP